LKVTGIQHLFFDLDHTLWDYDHNSAQALDGLYDDFQLAGLGLSPREKFQDAFRRANLKVWELFDENQVNRHSLRHKRMELVFEAFGLPYFVLENFNERYYELCSQGKKVVEGAPEILDQLSSRYNLHIITNGFEDALQNKLNGSGLGRFFQTITSSEKAGFKKPDAEYFSFALSSAKAVRENSLVIGDGLRTDVAGALGSRLPVIWFNPEKKPHPYPELIEIQSLFELPALLLKSENHSPESLVFT
jgi:putative hydrolase of the HAD superfamily